MICAFKLGKIKQNIEQYQICAKQKENTHIKYEYS